MPVVVENSKADAVIAETLLRLKAKKQIAARHPSQQYRDDPVAFVHDCFNWDEGESLTPYQAEICAALSAHRRVCVRGPHGLGKSALAALLILWFALTRDGREDWKIPTTASAWRQLAKFLWPEVHKWARKLKWSALGRGPFCERTELLALSLKLKTGEAFALASDKPALIEGAHAKSLLYVFDESKAIMADTWDSAEGAFSTGDCYFLSISTPGEPSGRFYDIQSRRPGYDDWWVRHVSRDEAIAAGRMSEKWAEERKLQWGEKSAVYINRVLGNFASSDEDGVIPLSWVEQANARWQAWRDRGEELGPLTSVGVDVARSGEDMTVLALRHGNVISELRRYSREDTMETTGRVAGILVAHGGRAAVDVIGIGAGVVDRLREMNQAVDAFTASAHSTATDRSGELGFLNIRAEAWWHLRELLDPANGDEVALPPDDTLIGDLTTPRWKVTSGGKIQIESKEDIRKRIGRSTNDGDAVVQAFWSGMDDLPLLLWGGGDYD